MALPIRIEGTATKWIIVITLAVHLIDLLTGGAIFSWGVKDVSIWAGQYHRLIMPTFLHANLPHILVNLYNLIILGGFLENYLGPKKFVFLYFLSGTVGYLFSLFFSPTTLAVGASASIVGMLGFILHHRLRYKPLVWSQLDTAFLTTILLNVIIALFVPNIDHFAHLGGLVGGVLCGSLLGFSPHRLNERRSKEAAVAGLILLGIFFVCLRPMTAAQGLKVIFPAAGEKLEAHYGYYFQPYVGNWLKLFWAYEGYPDELIDKYTRIDTSKPVRLSAYWRWDKGSGSAQSMSYSVIWKKDGQEKFKYYGQVLTSDPDNGMIYRRSFTPVLTGDELKGNWEVIIKTPQGSISARVTI
jgi:membrane associated rhomboid family serine protease